MNNKKFGKLINNNIVFAEQPIKLNGIQYFTIDSELMMQAGYKEIIYTEKPCNDIDGLYCATFIETDTAILQVWEKQNYSQEQQYKIYQKQTVKNIRTKYSLEDELKIMREYLHNLTDTNAKENFEQYNTFVEESKIKAHNLIYHD